VTTSQLSLAQELEDLDPLVKKRLNQAGFSTERLLNWAQEIGQDRDLRNRLSAVRPPEPSDIISFPDPTSENGKALQQLGEEALGLGQVALLVLAGGMATRMGGVVKALVEAIPNHTFLDFRLAEKKRLETKFGRPFPLWLMTSEATDGATRAALGEENLNGHDLAAFGQNVSLRLNHDKHLFRTTDGQPSLYPTGHGDVPEALQRSTLLDSFLAAGGRYVWIANLDNLGASIDPMLLGLHIRQKHELSVEVVEKAGDKGGIPVRYQEQAVICEDFRLPRDFDAQTVQVFNTNTFLVSAQSLQSYPDNWTYCEVEKQVEGKPAIQRERLLGELTFHLATRFIRVPRTGEFSRFLPVKGHEDLEKLRPALERIAAHLNLGS
jgi:UTP--glucose-1-phosphate uridylyltransferase